MTSPEFGINFNGATISFGSMMISNILVMIGASVYWAKIDFNLYHFILGIFVSISNTLGLHYCNLAYSFGPMGPI